MRITRRAALSFAAAGLLLAACGGTTPTSPSAVPSTMSASTPTPTPAPVATSGRVAIISIDGLRPDALMAAGAPNIMGLASRGAFTWRAKTIMPSTTLPSHTSMLSGYTPDAHGITWDDYAPMRGPIQVPTLFSVARAGGKRTALVAGKDKFQLFRDTGACDTFAIAPRGDEDVAAQAASLSSGRPDLLVVHLADVDLTGHAMQWMSSDYLSAVARADQAVGRILASLPDDVTVILTADHGGHLGGHGSDDLQDTTIPWIIAGPSTAKGHQLSTSVRTVDTAATAAYVLGLKLAPDAAGQPVLEAFGAR